MRKPVKHVARLLKYGTLASTLGLVASALIQIYGRFFMDTPPSWTEEAARFFFVYAMAFAAGLAMKDKYYVQFDVLFNRMGKHARLWINRMVLLLTLLLFLLLTVYGVQLILLGIPEHSPSLGTPMSIAFASMGLMGLSVSYFALLELLRTFGKPNKIL
ncbi:MAG: TRAP transporter small permease subunit [Bacteroidota bacterium]